jgi:hypothetical protein
LIIAQEIGDILGALFSTVGDQGSNDLRQLSYLQERSLALKKLPALDYKDFEFADLIDWLDHRYFDRDLNEIRIGQLLSNHIKNILIPEKKRILFDASLYVGIGGGYNRFKIKGYTLLGGRHYTVHGQRWIYGIGFGAGFSCGPSFSPKRIEICDPYKKRLSILQTNDFLYRNAVLYTDNQRTLHDQEEESFNVGFLLANGYAYTNIVKMEENFSPITSAGPLKKKLFWKTLQQLVSPNL